MNVLLYIPAFIIGIAVGVAVGIRWVKTEIWMHGVRKPHQRTPVHLLYGFFYVIPEAEYERVVRPQLPANNLTGKQAELMAAFNRAEREGGLMRDYLKE